MRSMKKADIFYKNKKLRTKKRAAITEPAQNQEITYKSKICSNQSQVNLEIGTRPRNTLQFTYENCKVALDIF